MHRTCSCESIANLPFRLSQRILSKERWKKETQDYLVSSFKNFWHGRPVQKIHRIISIANDFTEEEEIALFKQVDKKWL